MLWILIINGVFAHTIDGRCFPEEGPDCEDAPFVDDGVCHLDPRASEVAPFCSVNQPTHSL